MEGQQQRCALCRNPDAIREEGRPVFYRCPACKEFFVDKQFDDISKTSDVPDAFVLSGYARECSETGVDPPHFNYNEHIYEAGNRTPAHPSLNHRIPQSLSAAGDRLLLQVASKAERTRLGDRIEFLPKVDFPLCYSRDWREFHNVVTYLVDEGLITNDGTSHSDLVRLTSAGEERVSKLRSAAHDSTPPSEAQQHGPLKSLKAMAMKITNEPASRKYLLKEFVQELDGLDPDRFSNPLQFHELRAKYRNFAENPQRIEKVGLPPLMEVVEILDGYTNASADSNSREREEATTGSAEIAGSAALAAEARVRSLPGDDEELAPPTHDFDHSDASDRELGEVESGRITAASPSALLDAPANVDLLGRGNLVLALSTMFRSQRQGTPFTVGLLGDWGDGKSTVLNLVERDLRNSLGKDAFDFARFDAWEYERTDNIAAGLSQEVVRSIDTGVKSRIGRWRLRLRFISREHTWQFLGWVNALIFVIVMIVVVLWDSEAIVKLWNKDADLAAGSVGLAIVLLALAFWYLFNQLKSLFEHPLAVRLNTYLKLFDYGEHLGLVPVLKRHIRALCTMRLGRVRATRTRDWLWWFYIWHLRWLRRIGRRIVKRRRKKWPQNRRLIVYVDNLDRCSTDCIVKTLDAVRLVMDLKHVIVVIAVDHRIALKAVANHYEQLADPQRDAESIARDYLAKIIQLPIRLAAPEEDDINCFVRNRLFVDTIESEAPEAIPSNEVSKEQSSDDGSALASSARRETNAIPTIEPSRVRETTARATDASLESEYITYERLEGEMIHDAEEVDWFVELMQTFSFTNPRQLIRLRNSYRLLKIFAILRPDLQVRFRRERRMDFRRKLMAALFYYEFEAGLGQKDRELCRGFLKSPRLDELKDELPNNAYSVLHKLNSSTDLCIEFRHLYDEDGVPGPIANLVDSVILPFSETAANNWTSASAVPPG